MWIGADFVVCLPQILAAHPGAAVLFCNVLGQLGVERSDYEQRLAQLPGWLEGREWGSFHDRYSTRTRGGLPIELLPFRSRSSSTMSGLNSAHKALASMPSLALPTSWKASRSPVTTTSPRAAPPRT